MVDSIFSGLKREACNGTSVQRQAQPSSLKRHVETPISEYQKEILPNNANSSRRNQMPNDANDDAMLELSEVEEIAAKAAASLDPHPSMYTLARTRRGSAAAWDYTPTLRSQIIDGETEGRIKESDVLDVPLGEFGELGEGGDDKCPDGGLQAWLCVCGSFLIHFIVLGFTLYTFGVYQRYYTQVFPDSTPFQISWIGSIGAAAMPGFGFISGRLADKYGYRLMILIGGFVICLAYVLASFATAVWHLYLTQGLMYGIGMSLCYFPAVSVPSQWFKARRGLAVGIAVSGSGLGGLIGAPVVQALIDSVGWQWSLRILGIMALTAAIAGMLMIRTRVPPKTRKGPIIAFYLFKDKRFCLLACSSLIGAFGYFIPFYFIPSYAVAQGMTASQGAIAVGLTNGASAAGRIFQGLLADQFVGVFNSFVMCQFMSPMSILVVWMFSFTFPVLLVFALLYGFFAGGFVSLFPVCLAEMYGNSDLATINGTLAFANVAGSLAGSPTASIILEKAGWQALQGFAGGTLLVSSFFIFAVRQIQSDGKLIVRI